MFEEIFIFLSVIMLSPHSMESPSPSLGQLSWAPLTMGEAKGQSCKVNSWEGPGGLAPGRLPSPCVLSTGLWILLSSVSLRLLGCLVEVIITYFIEFLWALRLNCKACRVVLSTSKSPVNISNFYCPCLFRPSLPSFPKVSTVSPPPLLPSVNLCLRQ